MAEIHLGQNDTPTLQIHILIVNITIFYRLIYHSNLVAICTADGRIQPMIVTTSTTIPWFQPLVVCQSRFIVDIGIKEK
jgi:hypothetical protein